MNRMHITYILLFVPIVLISSWTNVRISLTALHGNSPIYGYNDYERLIHRLDSSTLHIYNHPGYFSSKNVYSLSNDIFYPRHRSPTQLFAARNSESNPSKDSESSTQEIAKIQAAMTRRTGIKKDLGQWASHGNPVTRQQENTLMPYMIRPGEYVSAFNLPQSRMDEIQKGCEIVDVELKQGLSLRKQALVDKVAYDANSRILKNIRKIEKAYLSGVNIKSLSVEFDVPAMAVLRNFFQSRVEKANPDMRFRDRNSIVKQIIREDPETCSQYLNSFDLIQIQEAKIIDQLSYSADGEIEKSESQAWEYSLYEYLDNNNVNYLKEEVLVDSGFSSTPDCVLLDDVYINGKLLRWIDCKNYYGSARSRIFLEKTLKQCKRYDGYFDGAGAIIYKLGYSADLVKKIPNSLLLDKGLLSDPNEGDKILD